MVALDKVYIKAKFPRKDSLVVLVETVAQTPGTSHTRIFLYSFRPIININIPHNLRWTSLSIYFR